MEKARLMSLGREIVERNKIENAKRAEEMAIQAFLKRQGQFNQLKAIFPFLEPINEDLRRFTMFGYEFYVQEGRCHTYDYYPKEQNVLCLKKLYNHWELEVNMPEGTWRNTVANNDELAVKLIEWEEQKRNYDNRRQEEARPARWYEKFL